MIFITVGTTKFPFPRMLEIVDNALSNLKFHEKVVAQIGINKYQFKYKHVLTYTEIPFDKMIYYISKARVVISHGGCGTMLLIHKYAKNKPILIPREKLYSEHIDNHQINYCKYLRKRGIANVILTNENDKPNILIFLKSPKIIAKNNIVNNLNQLTNKLNTYTQAQLKHKVKL